MPDLLKKESNLFKKKVLETASIESCKNINQRPGFFPIFLFLEELPLSQDKGHDQKNTKKLKENGIIYILMLFKSITHKSIRI